MNKNSCRHIIKAALLSVPALSFSMNSLADNHSPDFFGTLNFGVQKVEHQTDIDGQAFEAVVGVKGVYKVDDFTLVYKLEAELAPAVNMDNGQNEIEIKNALVVIPSQVGAFIIAPRVQSGHQDDMYRMIDIFEVNSASNVTLWGQPEAATSVFAYKTPSFANTYFVAAALTLNQGGTDTNHNDNFADAMAFRAIHKTDDLYLGAGYVNVSDDQTGASKDYNRASLTAGYTMDQVQLGMTFESQMDHPSGSDTNILGVAADFNLGDGLSAGIGYTDRNCEDDGRDDAMLAVIARKDIGENIQAWVELASYDEANNNYSAGIKVSL